MEENNFSMLLIVCLFYLEWNSFGHSSLVIQISIKHMCILASISLLALFALVIYQQILMLFFIIFIYPFFFGWVQTSKSSYRKLGVVLNLI